LSAAEQVLPPSNQVAAAQSAALVEIALAERIDPKMAIADEGAVVIVAVVGPCQAPKNWFWNIFAAFCKGKSEGQWQ
jgi:hypothetical protein